MALKVKTTGLNETIKMLEKLSLNTDEIMGDVTIEGAKIATDTMRSEIKNLRTSDKYAGGNGKRYAKKEDVQGLLDSLGYTPTQSKGTIIDSNVGFDGYNSNKTKKYPQGHANRMIANAINKGTSFMIAQPFINRTKKRAQESCINAMQKALDKIINAQTK